MDAQLGSGMEAALARIGQAWGWILAYGVASILAGAIAIVWPGTTLVVIAVLFAAQLVVTAIFRFAFAFTIPRESGWLRALLAVLAILSFGIGIYLLGHIGLTLLLLATLLGLFWIAQGIIELFLAIGHPELRGRAWTLFSGVLSIVAGGIALVVPGLSLLALTLVIGIWLVIFGATLIARGIQLRSLAHGLPGTPSRAVT